MEATFDMLDWIPGLIDLVADYLLAFFAALVFLLLLMRHYRRRAPAHNRNGFQCSGPARDLPSVS